MTLREFCVRNSFDPGNISKLERGVWRPSQQTLSKYAIALDLRPGSDEWQKFFDLAAVDQGELPADLRENEELTRRLPVLLRTLHNRRLTADELDKLIDIIKDS